MAGKPHRQSLKPRMGTDTTIDVRPPTADELRQALMTVLGSLPVGAEFRFFWCDGKKHMTMKFGAEPEQTLCLTRRGNGVGIPTPVHH